MACAQGPPNPPPPRAHSSHPQHGSQDLPTNRVCAQGSPRCVRAQASSWAWLTSHLNCMCVQAPPARRGMHAQGIRLPVWLTRPPPRRVRKAPQSDACVRAQPPSQARLTRPPQQPHALTAPIPSTAHKSPQWHERTSTTSPPPHDSQGPLTCSHMHPTACTNFFLES